MPTLRDIRQRISAVRNTAKITQAMRMVSAAKLRRAQEAILSARPYFQKLEDITLNLVEAVGEDYTHPLIQKPKSIKNIVVIIISSDRGLCGSFNSNLFRTVLKYINIDLKNQFPDANVKLITVGKRSCQFFRKEKVNILKEYAGVFASLNFSIVKDINSIISDGFLGGEFDQVVVYYNEFKNLLAQIPTLQNLLPLDTSRKTRVIVGKKDVVVEEKSKFNLDYIFEPDKSQILDELLPKNLDTQLWRAILESNAAEQAARMIAMENATNNANDLIKHLELVFNKARQAAITKEMLEIVSGANALKKG